MDKSICLAQFIKYTKHLHIRGEKIIENNYIPFHISGRTIMSGVSCIQFLLCTRAGIDIIFRFRQNPPHFLLTCCSYYPHKYPGLASSAMTCSETRNFPGKLRKKGGRMIRLRIRNGARTFRGRMIISLISWKNLLLMNRSNGLYPLLPGLQVF